MTHGSVCSGIGGFDLAAEWAGWTNVFNCETDPFCKTILKYFLPYAKQYNDLQDADFTLYRGLIDVFTGGLPCQSYSMAGERKGTADPRHLWPAMLRAIRTVCPRWVVVENVRGLVNWSGGLVFEQICSDLENEGYQVTPYLLPACGVDAPHERYRIWIIAQNPMRLRCEDNHSEKESGFGEFGLPCTRDYGQICGEEKFATDPDRFYGYVPGYDSRELFPVEASGLCEDNAGTGRTRVSSIGQGRTGRRRFRDAPCIPDWKHFPVEPPLCGGDDGLSEKLDAAAILEATGKTKRSDAYIAWCEASLRAYGNAIVPQVAFQIFKAINEYERITA